MNENNESSNRSVWNIRYQGDYSSNQLHSRHGSREEANIALAKAKQVARENGNSKLASSFYID